MIWRRLGPRHRARHISDLIRRHIGSRHRCAHRHEVLIFGVSADTMLALFLRIHLLDAQSGLPVDAVADWFTATQKHREWPDPGVGAEDLPPVVALSDVILTHIRLSLLVQVLDRRLVLEGESEVEPEEGRHQNAYDCVEDEGEDDEGVFPQLLIILVDESGLESPLNDFAEVINHGEERDICDNEDVCEEQKEELAVPESHAVVYPRTMMIHVEYTPITGRAVMASLGLEDVAHQAIAPSFVLVITQVEAPEDWDLPGVGYHCLKE